MALRLLTLGSRLKGRLIPLGSAGMHHEAAPVEGTREMVGYGINGQPVYMDRVDFPMPSLRWKEETPDVLALREREKGDWRKLSIEEKKALYRASFCQTFSEFTHPTGEWKSVLGYTFIIVGCGVWMYIFMKFFVYGPLPDSFSEENRRAQLRRMLDLKVNPITGLSSKWDYEKDDWKK
ncbi:hypothetical protein PPYR_01799 [Photinus pyralis]|uniref:Cytochrome c oxidase subunit 4 n=1 Tax=Photinus pyralis TaxID=7054 RepID=A0A1Y1JY77_PHOPY|nr:cytochrome c oxidase subunit 4 isoform 1, mitochondrial-like [Photinus pyralis]XP_031328797.1 cytochrome c oxidase subunit 4 isoform 1, mitochondrial-like [Photinus pyralis]XP_031329144.1 cytochrome c oxidase subunit 4 isoform 1, mitochondrial-like [Photinus pyralis]XP_031329145.1 cytochrome c oxidase subunit 4 isoform 1, mitochondrial-like [Photinus pyralis]KAB0804827.1 hypothetical protein PPYR_01797 [Photinus pyralis]KAB0804829.1 hypothetical protein PPYR_01799 [Photinus pyralis]